MRLCTACVHPDRAAIDADLLSGLSLRTIAGRYGLSAGAVHRHRTRHVDRPTVGEIREPSYFDPWQWSQWDGTQWVEIDTPDLADLIELRRSSDFRYSLGYADLGRPPSAARYDRMVPYTRKMYRLRKYSPRV